MRESGSLTQKHIYFDINRKQVLEAKTILIKNKNK